MSDVSSEVVRGDGNESFDKELESTLPSSSMYVGKETQTLAIERRPHVRRRVCLLLVLLAASVIFLLVVLLAALILLLLYQNTTLPVISSPSSTTSLPITLTVGSNTESSVRTTTSAIATTTQTS